MGIPFFPTLVYDYLIQSVDNLRQINLANQCVIIDGNSFIHFIYNRIVKEDKRRQMSQRLTGTPFGYDGCWETFHEILSLFQERCSSVIVVVDGILKSNLWQRDDPRQSNLYSVDMEDQEQLPTLLRHEFLNILYELNIRIVVARGQADPVIVRMAQENDAYIVSCDSDYHLYELSKGFVQLGCLNLKTLTGPSCQLTDVFGNIGAKGAALWATIIENTFITFEQLQATCSANFAPDKKKFFQWLNNPNVYTDKRQWITIQWLLLRFIQKIGTDAAYKQLIKLVSQTDRDQFDQIMESYINIQREPSFSTRDGNYIPYDIEERFIDGELDRKLIKILIDGKLPTSWQDLSSSNCCLLLPICHILLKQNYQNGENASVNPIITYEEEQYNLFEMVKSEDMPLLHDVPYLSENERRGYVLYCIYFALQAQVDECWDQVNEYYILWLSLLKLWYHKQQNKTSSVQLVLHALIISFLKHVLLDTYNENERDNVSIEQSSRPFLQYSLQELKNQFSLEVCAFQREKIARFSETINSNESITSALHEVEQFYESLAMINQFFGYPLHMPPPHICINQLTYRLAIVFSISKNISKDIYCLFKENKLLIDIMEEIRVFVCNS